ncbi:uncharacterized protein [Rutidosis leptorrhynchoides]|uniref:uncharacterized protein n=1 Tax=Rutidosis leptorrhynchoides TaxID=125765 RepID=UPI003A99809E
MSGTGVQITRGRGEDRLLYSSAAAVKARGGIYQADQLRRAKSDVTPSKKSEREPENRNESDRCSKPACEPVPRSNFERFLESITPHVPSQYLSKTTLRSLRTCDLEFQTYFELADLWESFREWSAYGAGVPLIMNDSDCVVQYYVPYLSAIQLYGVKSTVKSRRPGEDSDSDFRDCSSDGSSDSEADRGLQCSTEQRKDDMPSRIGRLSLRQNHTSLEEDSSSDESESTNSQGYLLFEYLERERPFCREPLADKISDLTCRFPKLKTLRSCDLSPSSWISVAWYPIYRIPTGPTLKDLDACFLTYHSLHTPVGGAQSVQPNLVRHGDMDGVCKLSLPVFGLASYKFKGSLWTPPSTGVDRQLVNSLMQSADNWLRLLAVNHPDFLFFART